MCSLNKGVGYGEFFFMSQTSGDTINNKKKQKKKMKCKQGPRRYMRRTMAQLQSFDEIKKIY